MQSEIAQRAAFEQVRYGQCWEDAGILVESLEPQGRHCLSIASAGDNALALLAAGAERVIALDMNPAQLACLALRVAAYRALDHAEFLELMGARPSARRAQLFALCRPHLTLVEQAFWDERSESIEQGVAAVGKFERYFAIFRRWVLPLVHSKKRVAQLLQGGSPQDRARFYDQHWNTWRWRGLFRLFFSRWVMGRLGRDPAFFAYVEGGIASHLLLRTRHALVTLNPAENPYLHWILLGQPGEVLPYAWREEAFLTIKSRLDRLEWHALSLEAFLNRYPKDRFDAFNLSDIFEYMSEENYLALLQKILAASQPSARLAYWNMAVPRSCPEEWQAQLRPLTDEAAAFFARDQAFFYRAFILEQVV